MYSNIFRPNKRIVYKFYSLFLYVRLFTYINDEISDEILMNLIIIK